MTRPGHAAVVSQLPLAGSGAGGAAQGRHRAQGRGARASSSRRRTCAPAAPGPTQLAQELAQGDAFILLIGESGVGKWQVPEYDEALDRWVKSGRTFPLIVVLLEGQTAPGLPFLRQLHWIVTPDPASEKDIARIFDAASGRGAQPAELWRYASPYRGLEAMEEKDSDYFFGRDAGNGRGARGARRAGPAAGADRQFGRGQILAGAGRRSGGAQASGLARARRMRRAHGRRSFRTAASGAFSRSSPAPSRSRRWSNCFLDAWQFDGDRSRAGEAAARLDRGCCTAAKPRWPT